MKKTLIALAALASTAAFAQSNVTIDGGIEVGVVKPIGAAAGQGARLDHPNGNSQFRLSGSEDLGGGLKANFFIAHRFSTESGGNDGSLNGRPDFQGETSVGVSGGFGSIKIGRAVTAFQGPNGNHDAHGNNGRQGSIANLASGYTSDPNDARNGAGAGRVDGFWYTSPNMGGLTVTANLGLKNTAAGGPLATGAKNFSSFTAVYSAGPIYVMGGMETNRRDDKAWALLGTYNLGVAKVGFGYGDVNNSVASALADFTNWGVSAWIPMGATLLQVGYSTTKNSATDVETSSKFGLGMEYNLSKRTRAYASFGSDSKVAAGASKSGYEVGIRHTF